MICKHDSLARSCQICDLESEIESLKAITELAVKGLQFYANENSWHTETDEAFPAMYDCGTKAKSALSEIERLQNG